MCLQTVLRAKRHHRRGNVIMVTTVTVCPSAVMTARWWLGVMPLAWQVFGYKPKEKVIPMIMATDEKSGDR